MSTVDLYFSASYSVNFGILDKTLYFVIKQRGQDTAEKFKTSDFMFGYGIKDNVDCFVLDISNIGLFIFPFDISLYPFENKNIIDTIDIAFITDDFDELAYKQFPLEQELGLKLREVFNLQIVNKKYDTFEKFLNIGLDVVNNLMDCSKLPKMIFFDVFTNTFAC